MKDNEKLSELVDSMIKSVKDKDITQTERLTDLQDIIENQREGIVKLGVENDGLKNRNDELEKIARPLIEYTDHEINNLKKDELVRIVEKNFPENYSDDLQEFSKLYDNNSRKPQSAIKAQVKVAELKKLVILFKNKMYPSIVSDSGMPSTSGSGFDKEKNMMLVNLLLASNRAGNDAGFNEFKEKLNKLLSKKMISSSDYEKFVKNWRAS